MTDKTNRSNIPKDPSKNLERVLSICKHWEKNLDRKEGVRDRTMSRLERIKELIQQDEEAILNGTMSDDDKVEAETRKTIARKYEFELYGDGKVPGLLKEISKLKSQLRWAERQQIPFLELEIDRIEAEKEAAAEAEETEPEPETLITAEA